MLSSLSSRLLVKLLLSAALLAVVALTLNLPKGSASTLRDDPCVADPGGPYTGTVGQSIQFDGSNSLDNFDAGGTVWFWSFGDGTSAHGGEYITHTYSAAGTYTVTLQMSNIYQPGHCSASTTATISN